MYIYIYIDTYIRIYMYTYICITELQLQIRDSQGKMMCVYGCLCFVFVCEKERGREGNLRALLRVNFLKVGSSHLVGCLP